MRREKIYAMSLVAVIAVAVIANATMNNRERQRETTDPSYAPSAAESKEYITPTMAYTQSPEVEEEHFWEGDDPNFTGYPEPTYSENELVMLAKMVYGEARGCSRDEQRLVVWTVFQRVDSDGFGDTVEAVLIAHKQFKGYKEHYPVDPDIYEMCAEEAAKWWHGETPPTMEPYAPALPYLFFEGDGTHNWFRGEWDE